MRRRPSSSKLDALELLLGFPPPRQWEQAVELVEVDLGSVVAAAGHRGRWITGVTVGTVTTTVPLRSYGVGEVFLHDGCTAVLSATGAQCLMVDERHEVAAALLASQDWTAGRGVASEPQDRSRPAARSRSGEAD